ncbi:3-oxoacyl-[acyl-carrier-protein] synthase III C-terminal domain-containing protein [Kitasatospora sp. GP82]|uniref:3-oxoacyl-ACP synthase III family protein n=1 Tax=Kitasatospora sp. GP82 TaxID=3035089 RepID=UPI0024733FA5|nr:3-oxoacyl-[acyl-carrier-protein] synthase III C-terminal domain-containing protein [Kitasatospora sp. GP82]MDH6125845.1 3-oxoacyl-[acyl-carrier-protein] synthase-3 [Kitasatospora sp. GP82]
MTSDARGSRFEALGAYLPSTVQSTPDLVASVVRPPDVDLEHITGVAERRVYDRRPEAGEDSYGLALKAARDALGHSRYDAADLDVVVSASITRFRDGDDFYFEPSFAGLLAHELGARRAIHFDVSNACAGMMTGVHLLDRMIRAGIVRNGLVVSGEQATRVAETAAREMVDSYDPQFASLSVGDSAVAVVLDRAVDEADRIHYVDLMTCAEYSHLCLGMPSDRTEGIALYTDNRQMHKADRLRMWPAFHGDQLAKLGHGFADEGFDYIVQHQVGTRFIDYVNRTGAREFGTEMPESLSVVEEFGNTASTAHFLVLHRHLKAGTARRGARYLLVPAASGVVTGALSATITNLGV